MCKYKLQETFLRKTFNRVLWNLNETPWKENNKKTTWIIIKFTKKIIKNNMNNNKKNWEVILWSQEGLNLREKKITNNPKKW